MRRGFLPFVLAFAIGAGSAAANQCSPTSVELRGDWGQAHFSVEVADDAQKQRLGLMFREKLPASSGMLFVYQRPHHAVFWMKNVPISLDMIFLDKTGKVMRIAQNARPFDETQIDGGQDILLILEINGGMARGLGISVGSELRHPSIDSAIALWPCPTE